MRSWRGEQRRCLRGTALLTCCWLAVLLLFEHSSYNNNNNNNNNSTRRRISKLHCCEHRFANLYLFNKYAINNIYCISYYKRGKSWNELSESELNDGN